MIVATVLRSGGHYSPVWVQKIQAQAAEHLPPHDFVCLSDVLVPGVEVVPLAHDWPGWWPKVELFTPGLFTERVLYLDLDTLIVGDASALFGFTGPMGLLSDFYQPRRCATGVMMFDPGAGRPIWERMRVNPPHWNSRMDFFVRDSGVKHARLQDAVPDTLASYKAHGLRDGPGKWPVVCFHGSPRPDEAPGWAGQAWREAGGLERAA